MTLVLHHPKIAPRGAITREWRRRKNGLSLPVTPQKTLPQTETVRHMNYYFPIKGFHTILHWFESLMAQYEAHPNIGLGKGPNKCIWPDIIIGPAQAREWSPHGCPTSTPRGNSLLPHQLLSRGRKGPGREYWARESVPSPARNAASIVLPVLLHGVRLGIGRRPAAERWSLESSTSSELTQSPHMAAAPKYPTPPPVSSSSSNHQPVHPIKKIKP